MQLFNRKIQVIIETETEKISIPDTQLVNDDFSSDLRIDFKVEKTDGKETNEAEIKIFGLSENTRSKITENLDDKKINVKVSLNVGYGENIKQIFFGDLLGLKVNIEKPDVTTVLTCKDGWKGLDQIISLSFDENTSTNQVLKKISDIAGLGSPQSNLPSLIYKNGFSYVGKISSALDKVVARIEREWSIRNNILLITEFNKSNDTQPRIVLNSKSGLINEPQRIKEQKVSARGGSEKTFDGWALKSLIIPGLDVKSLITVESPQKANYVVKNIIFTGSNRESDFFAEMEAIKND